MINCKKQLKEMMASLLSASVAQELISQNDMLNLSTLFNDAIKREKNKPL